METKPRSFDYVPRFDERSRAYPLRPLVKAQRLRSYTWRCSETLDQGREGACVGFAWAHELIARPVVVPDIQEDEAYAFYRYARQIDEWEGESYDGTSVLAGAKAVRERGFISEYRWAFSLDDVLFALGYLGPLVIGVEWRMDMLEPDKYGFIHATGPALGGHAILAKGVSIKNKAVKLHNSWGKEWGKNGECYISIRDLEELLVNGEACIPMGRTKGV